MASPVMVKDTWDPQLLLKYLAEAAQVEQPARVGVQQLLAASNQFFVQFPTSTARACTLLKQWTKFLQPAADPHPLRDVLFKLPSEWLCHTDPDNTVSARGRIKELTWPTHLLNGKKVGEVEEHINSAYPVLHHRCLPLYAAFLHYKRLHGSQVEKAVYKELGLVGLVDRLLKKRPIAFLGRNDQYLLRDKTKGTGGFESIGSKWEVAPLCLADYMSYDEMKLSALLSVSSKSFFINSGSRHNRGKVGGQGEPHEQQGIIVGMVGARLKKAGYMEWQDCVVTPKQNLKENGYGSNNDEPHLQQLWAQLWQTHLPKWEDGQQPHLVQLTKQQYFNTEVYKARVRLGAEMLLVEAGQRALAAGMKAYVHVVGLGLGVWRCSPMQDALFVEAWGQAMQAIDTSHVAHVDFSWIQCDQCQKVGDGGRLPGTQVTLHFSNRNLHDPVPPNTLLVVSYAWDGNSLPGNEYWLGRLSSTGDSAAACSSTVAELHNTHINSKVCGSNLHIATPSGIMHIADYAALAMKQAKTSC